MRDYDRHLREVKELLTDIRGAKQQLVHINTDYNEIVADGKKGQIEDLLVLVGDAKTKLDTINKEFLETPTEEFSSVLEELQDLELKIRSIHSNSLGLYNNINSKNTAIEQLHDELLVDGEILSTKTQIANFISAIEDDKNISSNTKDQILEFHKEIFGADDEENDENSIQDQINEFFEKLFSENGIKEEINIFVKKIKDLNSEYQKYYIDLNGQEEEKDEEGKIITAKKIGYKEETKQALAGLQSAKNTFNQDLIDLKEKGENEHKKVVSRIQELLPDAMGAGLASTYREAKVSHSYNLKDNIWLSAEEKKYKILEDQVLQEKSTEEFDFYKLLLRFSFFIKSILFKGLSQITLKCVKVTV